jgi:drug/metabolite transporter (DMT)-like permease
LEFTDLPFETSMILVALLGASAYGCGDFMGGRAAVRLSPSGAVALAQCAAMGVTVQAFLNGSGGLSAPDVIGPGLLGGAAYAIGLLLLYQGIAFGRIGVVAPVCGVVGILVPLAGDLVLARHIGVAQMTGILICCLAVVLLSVTREAPQSGVPPYFSLRLGVLSGIGYGTADLCLGMMEPEDGPAALMVARSVATLIAVSLLGFAAIRAGGFGRADAPVAGPPIPLRLAWVRPPRLRAMMPPATLAIFAGVFDSIGHMSYVHLATNGSMAVAAALVALYPMVLVVRAVVVLKERIIGAQYLGLLACAAGVAAISQ